MHGCVTTAFYKLWALFTAFPVAMVCFLCGSSGVCYLAAFSLQVFLWCQHWSGRLFSTYLPIFTGFVGLPSHRPSTVASNLLQMDTSIVVRGSTTVKQTQAVGSPKSNFLRKTWLRITTFFWSKISFWSHVNISQWVLTALISSRLRTHILHPAKVKEAAKRISFPRTQCIYDRRVPRFLRWLWGWNPGPTGTQVGQHSERFATWPHMHPVQTEHKALLIKPVQLFFQVGGNEILQMLSVYF